MFNYHWLFHWPILYSLLLLLYFEHYKVHISDKDDVEIKKPPKNMIGVEKLRSKFFMVVLDHIVRGFHIHVSQSSHRANHHSFQQDH